jgi:hypothetical protein
MIQRYFNTNVVGKAEKYGIPLEFSNWKTELEKRESIGLFHFSDSELFRSMF